MAILDILQYPDPRLRHQAALVPVVDERVQAIVDDMLATMYAARGIGLAATQVGIDERIAVIDVSEERSQPLVLINPVIAEPEGRETGEEGCLSIPDVVEKVTRPAQVRLQALDRDGGEYELDADGLLAVCIQHEVDHLDGRLLLDHLSLLKRQRIDKRLTKQRKRDGGSRRTG